MVELFSHQQKGAARLLDALKQYGSALDSSDTGTGKSLTALEVCRVTGARPFIITRKAIIHSWEKNCSDYGITPFEITNYEQLRTEGFKHGKVITKIRHVVGEDGKPVEKKSHDYAWDQNLGKVIFIFDEAHACRNLKSIQSKCLIRAVERYKTLMLTATPFSSPLEAFPIGLALKVFNNSTYYGWLLRHGCRKNRMGHWDFVVETEANMLAIHRELYPSRGCRTRRTEIPGFPTTLIEAVAIETGNGDEITAVYEKLLAARVESDYEKMRVGLPEELHDLAEPLAITRNLRLRQKAELLKCSAMAELAQDAADKGESVSVYLNFDASVEVMMKYLKTDVVIRGDGQDGHTRFKNLQAFQNNKTPFIIVNNAAGGAGISLHDPVKQKPRLSLISPPESAVLLKQILGRPHRLGGGYSRQLLCFSYGTVEQKVMENVKNKLNNIDLLVDGDLELALSVTA